MTANVRIAVPLVLAGVVGNNYAFLHDLVYRGRPVIWMGPLTWTLVAVSLLAILAGLWLLWSANRETPKT